MTTARPTEADAASRLGGSSIVATALIAIIHLYRHSLSLLLGPRCRFYPSCSAYAQACLRRYPLPTALARTGRRVFSCHPLHPGGVDLP